MTASVIELHVATAWPDFAEEMLFAQGAHAVRQIDAHDADRSGWVLEPPPGETPLWRDTITCGVFALDADLDAVEKVARELLPDGASLQFERRVIEDIDWLEAWKLHAQPLSFGGGRLWICPSHLSIDAPDAAVVTLDPGLAFGTGTHPSTALCLEWLANQDLSGKRILDFGCGSGILAIAALKLGAAHALATDIDPQAVAATMGNAVANGVDARIDCTTVDQFVDQAVDILLANILARPLVGLAPRLAACTESGGKIALAGILNEQAPEIHATYANWFNFDQDGERDGWSRVSGTRR